MRSHYTLTLSYKSCSSAHATILQYYSLANLASLSFLAAAVLRSSLSQPLYSQQKPNVICCCPAGFPPIAARSALCDHLCFHTCWSFGLPGTTLQQTLEPCPVVEQRCSTDGAPDFLLRRGVQAALPTDCHCMIGYLLPYHLGGLYSQ